MGRHTRLRPSASGIAFGWIAILLGALFCISAAADDQGTGIADETPLSDPAIVAVAPPLDATSDSVGATAAQFRVDEGGNATYSVPIQLPPGTAGLAPKLALTYNSRAPNGPLGPGWSIEGTSQIGRCRQTRENGDFMSGTTPIDGNPPPVNFSATDRFCMDGVRLLVTSGAYGANGSVYSPENDPTTKVTANVTNASAGPDTFIVKRKDGTTSSYGDTAVSPASRVSAVVNGASANLSWSLSRTQDTVGNYIDFLYQNQPAASTLPFAAGAIESVLKQVNYTGHLGTPAVAPYVNVVFNYTTLPAANVRLGYQAGIAFLQSQQLANIQVQQPEFPNPTTRYYGFNYAASASGSGFRQLTQIKECRDASQSVCFPATVFTWSAANYAFVNDTAQTQSGPDFTSLAGYKMADIDGDGRLDVVWAKNGDSACAGTSRLYVSFLDRTATGQMTLLTPSQAAVCAPINLLNNDAAWLLLDYDGDGRADLLIGGAGGSNWAAYASAGRPAPAARVFGTTNLLAGLATPITVPAGINAAATLIDVNGDGLPDLLYAGTAVSDGYSVILGRLLTRQNGVLKFSEPYSVKLNHSDDVCTGPLQTHCYVNFFSHDAGHRSAIPADINGDGRGDLTVAIDATQVVCDPICPRPSDNDTLFDPQVGTDAPAPASVVSHYYWYQFVADGITQPAGASSPVINFKQYWSREMGQSGGDMPDTSDKMYVADLNGDGLADILYQDRAVATTYHALINTGSGYQNPIAVANITSNNASPPIQLADINGDGRMDVVYFTSNTTSSYVSFAPGTAANWVFTAPTAVPGGGIHTGQPWVNLLGDFDGDGAPDFLMLQVQATSANLYTSRAAATSRYRPRDVITDFTNGLGAKTSVVYQPLTNKGVYQRGIDGEMPSVTQHNFGYGSPVFDVLAPIYVVSQATSSAPTRNTAGSVSTVYYRYQAALMQAGGRGFLGFWQTQAFDGNDQATSGQYVVSANAYGQSYPFVGMPLVSLTLKFSGALTRGSPELDACAANPETPAYNCFAPIGAPRWPDLLSSGVWVQYAGQQPMCNGAGCTAAPSSIIATCTTLSASEETPGPTSNFLDGLFTPPATPAPIFSYIQHSTSAQYDPDASGAGHANAIATTNADVYTCYEDAWGNATHARTVTRDAGNALVAQKLVANQYTNDTTNWFLGRLTNSTVTFARPGLAPVTRRSDFAYSATTGLLVSERVQQNQGADQDLRTMYTIDTLGNRTEAWQCSADLTDAQCKDAASTKQRPLDATGHSGMLVHRYAKTLFGTRGRYSIGSRLPFYSATLTNNLNEQTAYSITGRDEFGNVTQQSAINGIAQTALFGAMGRPYYSADNVGHASTTTYRLCGAVSCPGDAKFRSQTITAGAPSSWTYFDLLGRPVLKIGQSFDSNPAAQKFSGACSYYDAHGRAIYVSEPFFVPATAATDGSPTLNNSTPCASAAYATTTLYDGLGRVKRVTRPDTGTVQMSYVGLHTFTTDPRGYTWEEVKNALGETIQKRDPDVPSDPADNLIVNQSYDSAGNVVQISRDAGSGLITNTATYDALGRKRTMVDPDTGSSSFNYNAAGEVVKQTDAKGQVVQNDYDALGRLWRRNAPGTDGNTITDAWTFDTSPNGFGQIANESRTATASLAYGRATAYDTYGRLSQRSTSIAGSIYLESTAYDGFSRPKSQRDATGYTTTTNYTASGYLQSLTDSRINGTIYEVLAMTARGQVQQDRRGASSNMLGTLNYYPDSGRLASVCAGFGCTLQDLSFSFDLGGNLTQRARAISTAQPTIEQASYDAVGRLTTASLSKVQGVVQTPPYPLSRQTYDKLGDLCSFNGITNTYAGRSGCPNHGTTGSPHAVTSRVGGGTYTYDADGNLSGGSSGRTFTWNALNQVTSIVQGTAATTFDYAPDGSRFRRTDAAANATVYIVGNVEFVVVAGNSAANLARRYLGGVAIDFLYGVNASGGTETRYVFNDHLGSLSVYANTAGTKLSEQSFNAFGSRRDPVTWEGTATQPPGTPRGFTGHEHVNAQSVIHMNGRIYDPQLGRMLQPDPMADGSGQGLNRYSYVVNNPLTLTDPTGYSWFGDILRIAVGVVIAIYAPELLPFLGSFGSVVAAGFIAGAVTSGSLQGGIYGAFSAGLFYGIGSAFNNAGWATGGEHVFGTNFNAVGFTGKIIAHGIAGGVMSSLQGGKFGNGFASAGVAQAFSGGIDHIDAGSAGVSAQRVVAAAILGGTTSVIAGGKFANGAITAAFSYAFASAADSAATGSGSGRVSSPSQSTDLSLAAGEFGSPEAAVDAFGGAYAGAAGSSGSEYQTGVVQVWGGDGFGPPAYAYTTPFTGDPGSTVVPWGRYLPALQSTYGSDLVGYAHIHADHNMIFSIYDYNFMHAGNSPLYLYNQNGQTRMLTDSIVRSAVMSASLHGANQIALYAQRYNGFPGACVYGCGN